MARIRTLKPETATDRKLASVSRDARLTFLYLISQADDDGLVRAEPRQLLGALYPHDQEVTSDVLEPWLNELGSIRVIRFRKTLDGMRVIQIVNWDKHQKIKHRSKPFLLTQLEEERKEPRRKRSGAPPEPRGRASGESPEEFPPPSGDSGGAESRVLSPESRVLSPEPGGRRQEAEAPAAAAALLHVEPVRDCLPVEFRAAYDGYVRSHRFPQSLDAELHAIAQGVPVGPAYSWEEIGRALQQMAAKNREFAPNRVRGFCKINREDLENGELEEMTDEFGIMRTHRKDPRSGEWIPV